MLGDPVIGGIEPLGHDHPSDQGAVGAPQPAIADEMRDELMACCDPQNFVFHRTGIAINIDFRHSCFLSIFVLGQFSSRVPPTSPDLVYPLRACQHRGNGKFRESSMSSVTTFPANKAPDSTERSLRVDLAAAFRLAVEFNWHESVGNHFSAAVSADGHQFLMNRKWMHFSQVTASNLLLLDVDDPDVMNRADAPDPSAWCIHGRLHALAPQARCILHLHPPYATALATLADPELKPIDQNTARFYGRIAIDRQFSGIADQRQEGERLAQLLGKPSVS